MLKDKLLLRYSTGLPAQKGNWPGRKKNWCPCSSLQFLCSNWPWKPSMACLASRRWIPWSRPGTADPSRRRIRHRSRPGSPSWLLSLDGKSKSPGLWRCPMWVRGRPSRYRCETLPGKKERSSLFHAWGLLKCTASSINQDIKEIFEIILVLLRLHP